MIYLCKTQNREKFTRDMLGLEIDKHIQGINRVLIKPNIVSYESYPSTTHPLVLNACLDYFLSHNKQVAVADGPAPDAGDSREILDNHELKKICDSFNVPLLDFIKSEMKTLEFDDFIVEISSIPFQYDFIVSLPVLKSHSICQFTGALKNQFGLISRRSRIKLHLGGKDIDRVIAVINTVARPNYYIMDAVDTLINTNELRHGGKKQSLGFMLAGSDPVGLDALGLRIIQRVEPNLKGKTAGDIKYLKYAVDLNLGNPSHEVTTLPDPDL